MPENYNFGSGELRQAIYELLVEDDTLMDMLAANNAWWLAKSEKKKEYSVVPASKGDKLTATPFLTVQNLVDSQVGTNLKNAFFVVRCYNATDKTYVEIDDVLRRVHTLLHRHTFQLDGLASVNTVYETTGAELEDQAYGLNFRESQYRVEYI